MTAIVLCLLSTITGEPAVAAPATAAVTTPNWRENVFFGLHFDLHPNPGDKELGKDTTYDHIRAELEKVKPDFVQYDCKGHPGWTGYPTKVGSPAPGIVNDALKVWRQVTKDMGIPLSIHYSGVWDDRAIELHPEWARIQPDGEKDPHHTCPLSTYIDELLIPELLEVVKEYDIDGMWIDGENWASFPCYCDRCKAEFTKRTTFADIPTEKGQPHWAEWLAFNRDLFTEHVTRYTNAVHALKPGVMVCSNWMYSVRMPEPIQAPIDYLSGDFDPSFGSERACAEARFISSRGKPWDLMAWTFLNTGGQGWTMKTPEHLCQESAEVLAQGGTVFYYDQPQRSGHLTGWHMDLMSEVARFCRARQPFCHKTKTIPQVAILHSETVYYTRNSPLFNFDGANEPMEGALHAVLENGYSADILNEEMFLERGKQYPVVIVPEQPGLPEKIKKALQEYVFMGGHLILSGAETTHELANLAGVEIIAEDGKVIPQKDNSVIASLTAQKESTRYVPSGNGCVIVSGVWQNVKCTSAKELAPLLDQQEIDKNKTGYPSATLNTILKGSVLTFPGPVFQAYFHSHYPGLRSFIGDQLAAMNASGLIKRDGPWWVEMAARKKDGKTLLQFVNRSAAGYLAPNRHIVEHVPDAGSFTVTIPMPEKPHRCYMAPDAVGVEWSWVNGVLKATVNGLAIHNVLVIE